eukprot:TRINITY_DN594_c0_g1_i13.p2 TRINITY_DN594_c0_g1~~TRINITY_DN594_c0_g1_i13.p2  ORF type:complete len:100 (-),score=15.13 TRINITY_DN594_c0_g1_i13:143-442(-)
MGQARFFFNLTSIPSSSHSHFYPCLTGGIFVVGTDLYLDSPESTKWPHILNVEMDIRSEESWVQLFVVAYGLENVQKLRIILPHRTDEGTLFIWGSRPR